MFPQDGHCNFESATVAIEHAHAILIVLSDKACAALKEDDADQNAFYQLIRTACERERKDLSRILPLFLYQTIYHEDDVGLVRFSTWAYKCKNEEVRSYMEHIGSLQGVFSDPAEWESKWEKLHSFWQESHNSLVPLNLTNLGKELDWSQIIRTVCGCALGSLCMLFSLCMLCCRCTICGPGWVQFRRGLVIGNVVILLLISLFFLLLTTFTNASGCTDQTCELRARQLKTIEYWVGSIVGIVAIFVLLISWYCLDQEEKIIMRGRLARDRKKQHLSSDNKSASFQSERQVAHFV